ncbi:hypothetical protein Bca52824_074118 [Brassica carinata]|uniref:Uncharacterized protein n=1 Tax=Brassica carinata TaxID=52824 RepID=A0A8X7QGI4_BRACI|nr:hypothetical protein Bca52824_074118 [Brassica carinata]
MSDQIQRNMIQKTKVTGKSIEEVSIPEIGPSNSEGIEEILIETGVGELEEGQIDEGWKDVNAGKSRSPTKRIFLILNELNDNGELDREETQVEVEEDIKKDDLVEGIDTIEEETVREEGKQLEVNRDKEDKEKEVENAEGEVNVKCLSKNLSMTGFFWNVRGFNKSSKHGVVKDWILSKDLKFGCLLETRVKESKPKHIVSSYGKHLAIGFQTSKQLFEGDREIVLCFSVVRARLKDK